MKLFLKFFIACVSLAFSATLSSCSSSAKVVVSNGVDLSTYKYVCIGNEQTGDRALDDVMLQVKNAIRDTRLKTIIPSYLPYDYKGHTLSPFIDITTERHDGGHTYITITYHDIDTEQPIVVVKSSGIGLSIEQDQDLALSAIKKKLHNVFGKKD